MASFPCTTIALMMMVTLLIPANGQSSNGGNSGNSLCTGAMVRSFTPCISFLTGGSSGGSSSPTSGCCTSLRDLMSNGQDCLCLIITGGVPLQVPINQTVAMSLPRACKMSGVPVQCQATAASPVPAPDQGGSGLGPGSPPSNLSPGTPGSFLPQPLTPPTPSDGGLTPSLTPPTGDIVPTLTPPGMRPTLDPSVAAPPSYPSVWPSILTSALGIIMMMKLLH